MSLEVKSTKDLAYGGLSMFVYGPPKTGKTTFASTFPNPLMLALEKGLVGLRDLSIDYVEPETWGEYLTILLELQKSAKPGVVTFRGKEYNSVIIDPLNELYSMVMRDVMRATSGRETPSLPDYGLTGIRVERSLVDIASLPVHTCITCLEATDKDELTGRIWAGALLPGKLAKKVPALFDFVFHTETEPTKDGTGVNYVLLTQSLGIVNAGGRYGKSKVGLREPANFTLIHKKITGGNNAK